MATFKRDLYGVQKVSERSGSLTIDGGGTMSIDLSQGTTFFVHLTSVITDIVTTNVPTGSASSFTLFFSANGTPYSVTWPAKFKWPGAVAPSITPTSQSIDVFSFISLDAGDTWYSFTGGQAL